MSVEENAPVPQGAPHPPVRRATMRDVAALAGVSIKTVSRVINGVSSVAPPLREKVQQAIDQLEFQPNLAASNLRRTDRRTGQIALLLEDLSNPYSATLTRTIEDVARAHNTLVVAGSVDEDPQREIELARAFTQHRADGLVIVPTTSDQAYLHSEVRVGTPLVFVDRPPRGILADSVLSTNTDGAAQAVRHLVDHAHRRIAYLGDYSSISTAEQRFRGYQEEMGRNGLPIDPRLVRHDLHDIEAAVSAARELLALDDPPTALFTSQNLVTIGALTALRSLGLQHRVAVVGFDDFPLGDLLDPAVTVVAQDVPRIGATAARLLFERIEASDQLPPREHLVPTRFLVRGSGEIPPLDDVR
ncbi:LacI family transcriptional regulator [Nocardiopsis gilva YIM 90087]|uniref:LacI family transcriptional regulator n=1 Tax=Nocardiopsis gilva YIM 90087 TaxID=1235441 RepID=A0A223SAI7_9ACTN|nr:LacI family DNA-binding transcriptional regulator [Nocardiopsis gilva]ASU85142.1 LacI family transcriptional regulator [Nocardiopsis gilva YIM 90087]